MHDDIAFELPAFSRKGPGPGPAAGTALTRWDRALACQSADAGCLDWFGIDPRLIEGCRLDDLLAQRNRSLLPLAQRALGGDAQTALHAFRIGDDCRTGIVVFVPVWRGSQVDGVLMHLLPGSAPA